MSFRNNEKAQAYLQKKKVPELFESMLTGLLFHQPENHISYLEECLANFKQSSEPLKWNTFVSMAHGRHAKAFGVAPVENKVAASTTPLPPIVESHTTTAEDESVKSASVPATLDAKTVLPPIAGDDNSNGSEKVVEAAKSSSSLAEPLPPIAASPAEVKDSEVTAVVSGGAENAELTMKENMTPLPPITPKQADPAVQFGEVYFVLGGPGSGKGTQCARIVEKFGFAHLCTGDLFRAEVKKGTELGQKISDIIKEGGLVSSDITVSLLKTAMLERNEANGFLIDGFPREMEQAKIFEENVCPCTRVLLFKCSDEVMAERLKQRGLTSGRSDDNEETICKRLNTFHEHTIPVISHYQQNNKVWEVNAESTVDEVFSKVEELFSVKGNMAPLPPITPRQAGPAVQFGEVYFVLGGPGSGKGTQCARIVEKFGFAHLSTGDLFRAEVKKGTELGQKISNIIKEGGLVSSDITVSLLKAAMLERDEANGFLIDGFPREMEQAKIFEENVCPCTRVLLFKCSDEVMAERLKQRGLTSGRSDDNEETICKRLNTFHEHTIPVISHYQQNNKVWEVNAESTVDEVFSKVEELFSVKGNMAPLPPITPRQAGPAVQFGEVYFVLGGPGSGKGTQCARIVEKFGFAHLSTGDLFRAEVKKGTELGQKISNIIKEGGLVSSDITVSLLKAAMLERDEANGFLIDGFPREMEQAKIFEENVCPCTRVLLFKCSDEVMAERLKQRGLTSGRSDDNEETIRKRLKTFNEHTIPVISHYQQSNKVWEVNAESTVDEVFSKVEELFCDHSQAPSTSQQNST